eukprot:gene5040-6271_t
MIDVYLVNNNECLVWNPDDIYTIRTKYRLLGNFLGGAGNLKNLSTINTVPLLLSPYEVTLGIENQWFRLIDESCQFSAPTTQELSAFQQSRDSDAEKQIEKYIKDRQQKQLEFMNKNNNSSKLLEKQKMELIKQNSHCVNVPIYTSTEEAIEKEPESGSWRKRRSELYSKEIKKDDWKFPVNDGDITKYCVFKDLWEKGLFISGGSKFGGTFLAYKGDPLLYHASFIVLVKQYHQEFKSLDIITSARLAVNVNKITLLASIDNNNSSDDEKVRYLSIQWKGVT